MLRWTIDAFVHPGSDAASNLVHLIGTLESSNPLNPMYPLGAFSVALWQFGCFRWSSRVPQGSRFLGGLVIKSGYEGVIKLEFGSEGTDVRTRTADMKVADYVSM